MRPSGYGSFTTPNTASILLAAPTRMKGVANGLRTVILNLGAAPGTAADLAMTAAFLSPALKNLVYPGPAGLQETEIGLLWAVFSATYLGFTVLPATSALGLFWVQCRGNLTEPLAFD